MSTKPPKIFAAGEAQRPENAGHWSPSMVREKAEKLASQRMKWGVFGAMLGALAVVTLFGSVASASTPPVIIALAGAGMAAAGGVFGWLLGQFAVAMQTPMHTQYAEQSPSVAHAEHATHWSSREDSSYDRDDELIPQSDDGFVRGGPYGWIAPEHEGFHMCGPSLVRNPLSTVHRIDDEGNLVPPFPWTEWRAAGQVCELMSFGEGYVDAEKQICSTEQILDQIGRYRPS